MIKHPEEFITLNMSLYDIFSQKLPDMMLRPEEPLAEHTSFRIGGPAELMAFPKNAEELSALLSVSHDMDIRPVILGAGSNVLAPDEGLRGLVICMKAFDGIEQRSETSFYADCGATLKKAAIFAREQSLTGLEFAHGIPGSVGGGVYMNAGAYGGELRQVVTKTTVMTPDGTVKTVLGDAQDFSYRHSVFMEQDCIILGAEFQLQKGELEAIRARMQELSDKRRASQPLELPSAGSTFKRPIGGYAAALIEQAGLKGYRHGGAAVSEKHSGFVVNKGGATAKDVLELMEEVKQRVYESSGILLEPEVRIL